MRFSVKVISVLLVPLSFFFSFCSSFLYKDEAAAEAVQTRWLFLFTSKDVCVCMCLHAWRLYSTSSSAAWVRGAGSRPRCTLSTFIKLHVSGSVGVCLNVPVRKCVYITSCVQGRAVLLWGALVLSPYKKVCTSWRLFWKSFFSSLSKVQRFLCYETRTNQKW